jgi:hypothetical protein
MSQVSLNELKFGGNILSQRNRARLNKFSRLNTSFGSFWCTPQASVPCTVYSVLWKGRFKATAVFPI